MEDTLKRKTVAGVKWSTLATIVKTIIQIIKISVLTFLLDKSDFGIIAIAMMVISFTEIFSNLGLAVGIIHKQEITDTQYSSIYWLNILAAFFIFIVLLAATPFLAAFYKEPILNSVIPLLGLQVVINSFGKIFQTIKTKELDFAFISKVTMLSVFLGFILTIILALLGVGVFSLVWGQLFQVAVNQGLYALYGLKERRLAFRLNIGEIREFVSIGSYQLGAQVLDFISSRVDIFLIGHFFGMNDLGVYNIAKELILKPYQLINALITNVASSAFSRIQNDLAAIKRNYAKIVRFVTSLSFPFYVVLFIFAEAVVALLYAPEFSTVAIFLRILVAVGFLSSINSICSILIIAKGRTDIGFNWTVIRVIISTVVILLASFFDIYTVAISQSVISFLFFLVYWKIAVYPLSSIGLREYLGIFWQSALVSVVLGVPFMLAVYNLNMPVYIALSLAIIYGLLYVAYYWYYNRSVMNELVAIVRRRQ